MDHDQMTFVGQLSQKSRNFQEWLDVNANECLQHLEHIYNHFVPTVMTFENGNIKVYLSKVTGNNRRRDHENDPARFQNLD
ncbi:MAG: hypothetical protein EOP45_19385 [Sphingobacteriaceae bacterium]|nr:MAG: hypothetical protein EOP45_19385 [Sphingobacteriaceae bacterium]